MIVFGRDGTAVTVVTETGVPEDKGALSMLWRWDTGKEWAAQLLFERLRDRLFARVQAIRKEAYERGSKDGRGRNAKETWFEGRL